jgi:DNA-binding NarL/FixJ family response regulator
VLFLDDDPGAASALLGYLAENGLPIFGRIGDAVPLENDGSEPDIVIVDPQMTGLDVWYLLGSTRNRFPHARIVAYTDADGLPAEFIDSVLSEGADALVVKDGCEEKLLSAFGRVLSGRKWLDPALFRNSRPAA